MKRRFLLPLWWVVIPSLTVLGQEALYPVRERTDIPIALTADRSAFAVERTFEHKLTLGFPTDDNASFLPKTRAPIVVLWLRIQNVSQRPIEFNTAKFASTDDEGRMYAALAPDEACNRILAEASGGSIGTRTLRAMSLGRLAGKPTEDQVREEILRNSLRSGQIPAAAVREGLIYFEAPQRKKFTVSITLGDLWSRPLVFSTEKQK